MYDDFERELGRHSLFLQMLATEKIEISDDVMAYFREHPDEIDELTAPTRVHRLFLWAGTGLGILAIAISSSLAPIFGSEAGLVSFALDIVRECGIALFGAALTAYFMGVLLNAQQRRARAFRKEIRRRLREDTP